MAACKKQADPTDTPASEPPILETPYWHIGRHVTVKAAALAAIVHRDVTTDRAVIVHTVADSRGLIGVSFSQPLAYQWLAERHQLFDVSGKPQKDAKGRAIFEEPHYVESRYWGGWFTPSDLD